LNGQADRVGWWGERQGGAAVTGFKDLLVVVDDSKSSGNRIDVAVQVANRFGTHLTGLYVTQPVMIPAYIQAEMVGSMSDAMPPIVPIGVPGGMFKVDSPAQREAARRAQQLFRSRAEVAGITTEWREREGDLVEITVLHARYADMTIVGQADPDEGNGSRRVLPEHLVLDVGRPILVVPYVGTFRTVGERVLVAWNGSRAATRAVNDALPILQKAAKVTVLTINPQGGVSGEGDVPGADLALHLSRHGVKAEAARITVEDIKAAEMLLSSASDLQADLIVMGGYGHSRAREIVLGGSTREILRTMTVPTFMSH
jgi:nucleotide-binding universal stress UspA family protein